MLWQGKVFHNSIYFCFPWIDILQLGMELQKWLGILNFIENNIGKNKYQILWNVKFKE